MNVDAHVHVVVPGLLRAAAPEEAWRPHIAREAGTQVVELGGRRIGAVVEEFVDVGRILERQAERGIDHVVLSPWVHLLSPTPSTDEALRRCRLLNDGLLAMRDGHAGRVSVLGAVPMQDPDRAARELEELMAGGRFAGVEVTASVGGVYLGDDRFEPFWAAAEAHGALVFIHPTTAGIGVTALEDYYLTNLVGNPLETTIAAAHMVFAGVLERHPGLHVLLAHAGGAVLALRGRLEHAHAFQSQARARLRESPTASLRRFFYDSVTHDPSLLSQLVETVGADHVVLGSDFPFDMADHDPLGSLRATALAAGDQAAVAGGNAARLLGLRT